MPGAGPNNAKVQNLLTGSRHSFYLTQAVEAERQKPGVITDRWPTPTTRDYKGAYSEQSQTAKPRNLLPDAVKRVPTPTAHDAKGNGFKGQLQTEISGQLNPTWVEWLMGFPLGWTDLGPSVTRSSRRSSR
jgi:hypothetical protein